ncbi:c-type cytochrome biogenesis protein CcmI [Rhizobium halophytocola]|uniref:Cytochrome c-type biogenesis protein CcmH n=1 Tax=Rhizobium halophytocola TaxID=735519 RepID=A0ABS4DYX3_9HYPH|nr:c-type cytochrome biogenesis protein CcmI [Rhizobium halophytocola]MBP1850887.1 cytochrome c-type biogenesis protein CcmH [Rhizobium halophytocola]
MTFWIAAAILTFVVALFLLLPLWRSREVVATVSAGEAAVYRDQLGELERDRETGTIAPEDADYARAEIARRLIAVSHEEEQAAAGVDGRHRLAQVFVIVLLPVIALGLYLGTGAPGIPDQPLAARLENPGNNLALLVTKVEKHLAANPDDGSGWDVVAPIYMRMGRFGDADLAYRNAIRLLGENAVRLKGLGEAVIAQAEGVVTDEARSAFEKALKLAPDDPQAQYYLALALEQSGKKDEARAAFEAIVETSPKDAPWLEVVNRHVEANGGTVAAAPAGGAGAATEGSVASAPGNPSAADVAAANQMSGKDREQMIRGMVDSLDAKLRDDPNNAAGWSRLVRSYAMLDEQAKALDALKRGLAAFPPDSEQGKTLLAEARTLKLPVEDALK